MQESVIYRSIQHDEKRAIAINFLREGLSVEAVARGTGLSIEEVQQLQQQMNAVPQSLIRLKKRTVSTQHNNPVGADWRS
jgi:transposase